MPDYQLYRVEQLLGALTRTDGDFPWQYGTFAPTETFEAVRPLFERLLQFLKADRLNQWEEEWQGVVSSGIRLEQVGNGPIDKFVLQLIGPVASWRF